MEQREGYKVKVTEVRRVAPAEDEYAAEMDVWMFEVGKPCPRCGLLVGAEVDGRPRVHTLAMCIELLRAEVERLTTNWYTGDLLHDRELGLAEKEMPWVVKAMQEHIEDLRKMLFAE